MNANLTTTITAAVLAALSGPLFADDSFRVALSSELSLDRASIAEGIDGSRSVWAQRSYAEPISLGVDPDSGAPIYLHRSVQVRYDVDCFRGKLNMTAWRLYGDASAQGMLVWSDQLDAAQAAYLYAPQSFEERSVMTELCNDSVATTR